MKTIKNLLLITFAFLIFNACKKEAKLLTVTDYDGNVYQTVKIGDQIWMAENLKTMHYMNGEAINNITDATLWKNATEGAWCDNPEVTDYAKTFGHLYNWYAVNDSRKLLLEGWHVATDSDWAVLVESLGGETVAGGQLKETGTAHWDNPNTGSTNSSGFTALPAGYRGTNINTVAYFDVGVASSFWTATQYDVNSAGAWERYIYVNDNQLQKDAILKYYGFSVRCVKD